MGLNPLLIWGWGAAVIFPIFKVRVELDGEYMDCGRRRKNMYLGFKEKD